MSRPKDRTFKITYGVDDGYAGGSRPHWTTFDADFNGDETGEDLKELFWEEIQRAFLESCHPHSDQEAEFVAWARERIAEQDGNE